MWWSNKGGGNSNLFQEKYCTIQTFTYNNERQRKISVVPCLRIGSKCRLHPPATFAVVIVTDGQKCNFTSKELGAKFVVRLLVHLYCSHGYLRNKVASPLPLSRGAIVTSLLLGKGWKVRLCKSCSQQEACLLRTSIALHVYVTR